jgi:hypothetical protein
MKPLEMKMREGEEGQGRGHVVFIQPGRTGRFPREFGLASFLLKTNGPKHMYLEMEIKDTFMPSIT